MANDVGKQNWDSSKWTFDDGTQVEVSTFGLDEIKRIYHAIAAHPDTLHHALPSVLWEALRDRANDLAQ